MLTLFDISALYEMNFKEFLNEINRVMGIDLPGHWAHMTGAVLRRCELRCNDRNEMHPTRKALRDTYARNREKNSAYPVHEQQSTKHRKNSVTSQVTGTALRYKEITTSSVRVAEPPKPQIRIERKIKPSKDHPWYKSKSSKKGKGEIQTGL